MLVCDVGPQTEDSHLHREASQAGELSSLDGQDWGFNTQSGRGTYNKQPINT